MDRYRITKGDNHACLCTMRFTYWLPLFNAGEHIPCIVLESLDFCRRQKGLILHAYLLMIDHMHLIARHDDLSGALRDFKSWTSRRISEALEKDGHQRWLGLMETRAATTAAGHDRKVWEDGFHPRQIGSDAIFLQKLDYVHNNPVRKGFVARAEDWRWSSAGNYANHRDTLLEIDPIGPLII